MYKSFGGALGVQKLNSATALIKRHEKEAAEYVLHRAGRSQKVDQLLREGWQWKIHSEGTIPWIFVIFSDGSTWGPGDDLEQKAYLRGKFDAYKQIQIQKYKENWNSH